MKSRTEARNEANFAKNPSKSKKQWPQKTRNTDNHKIKKD